jgi:hypothetical protein
MVGLPVQGGNGRCGGSRRADGGRCSSTQPGALPCMRRTLDGASKRVGAKSTRMGGDAQEHTATRE